MNTGHFVRLVISNKKTAIVVVSVVGFLKTESLPFVKGKTEGFTGAKPVPPGVDGFELLLKEKPAKAAEGFFG